LSEAKLEEMALLKPGDPVGASFTDLADQITPKMNIDDEALRALYYFCVMEVTGHALKTGVHVAKAGKRKGIVSLLFAVGCCLMSVDGLIRVCPSVFRRSDYHPRERCGTNVQHPAIVRNIRSFAVGATRKIRTRSNQLVYQDLCETLRVCLFVCLFVRLFNAFV